MPYAAPDDLKALTQCDHENAALVLDLASSTVDAVVQHDLNEGKESAILRPSGGRTLWVVPAGWPLEIVSLVEGDDTLADGEDFRVRADGSLRRLGGDEWTGEVEVTYMTGFAVDSVELLTAKRITLEVAARAVANPQLLDTISIDGTSPSFVVRDGQGVLPQLTLSAAQRADLQRFRWRRRLA